jgi:4-amino-4-deoxy-L-arabinose transferase-like glycosyltransferase
VAVLAFVLYTWDLSRNGLGNSFYAAAVKSGTASWKAFFFGSLDPASFTTVDKPPVSLWVQELSARVFGFSSWSTLLPEALAGVASVLIVYRLVRRWAGEVAAVLAAVAFALTPVAVVMFRYNNPDAVLTLLLVLAAWALWSALESAKTWKLAACGALLGLAFLTKTLEAFIVLPAFGLVYLVAGKPALGRRVVQLLVAGVTLVVASTWWVAIVELWPTSARPYIGGSTNNSEWNLIFGYNGFSRIIGSSGPTGAPRGGGVSFAGPPGLLRMFNDQLGGQVAWLIPVAVLGLVAGVVLAGRAPRTDRARAGYLLWGGWMVMDVAVFSEARGIFHPYYAVALAPALAAVAGAGSVALWRVGRATRRLSVLLPAAVVLTALWAMLLLDRTPNYDPGLAPAVLVGGIVAAAGLWVSVLGLVRARSFAVSAGSLAVGVSLAGPAAYSLTTVSASTAGALATAGPSTVGGPGGSAGGPGRSAFLSAAARAGVSVPAGGPRGEVPGGLGGEASASTGLVHYLEAHRGSATYLVATTGSQAAAPLIIATGQPVMAMGGFGGSDPNPTLAQFERLVATGQVHYVLVSGGTPGGRGLPGIFGVPGNGSGPGTAPNTGGPVGRAGAPPFGTAPNGGPPRAGFPRSASGSGPPRGGPGSGTVQAINQWVTQHGTLVPASRYGGSNGEQLYYVS